MALGGACTSLLDVDGFQYLGGGATGGGATGGGATGGSGASSGTGGSGGCVAAECPGNDTSCQSRVCGTDGCGLEWAPEGTDCNEEGGVICDGNGSCVECVDGSQCADGMSCQLNQCVPATCTNAVKDGDETDIDCGGASDCQSGLCTGGTCSACTVSSQCPSGQYCDNGVCESTKPNGAPCLTDPECASGHCPDDDLVCCAAACNGLCEACVQSKSGSANGSCGEVTGGTDPDQECPASTCDGAGKCAPICGQSPDPPGSGACPNACSFCMNNNKTCVIECGGNTCKNGPVSCPSGFDCTINCSNIDSCLGATINCPAEYKCDLLCSASDSCGSATFNCLDGPCNVLCSVDSACSGLGVSCGSNSCAASCPGNGTAPNMSCGSSCACTGC